MNFKNRGGPSFFKILLRESIDRLPLPPTYAKKYLENGIIKKQTVVLKIKSGVKWSVRYLKIKEKYYFTDGWLKFMKDNRLQSGVFLVFWLLTRSPNLIFQVFIFEPNGCLKQPFNSDDAGASNRKITFAKDTTDYNDSSESMQHMIKRVIMKYHSHSMAMKNGFVRATGINGYGSVQLRNDNGKRWNVKLQTYRSYSITRMAAGWNDFMKDNKIKIGDICEFYHVKSNLVHVHVLTAEEGNLVKLESI